MKENPSLPSGLDAAKERHERTLQKIGWVEKWIPGVSTLSRHPKYGSWVPVAFTIVEVGLGILALIFIVPLLTKIPWPQMHLSFPKINLPHIPWPRIELPAIPVWLDTILYWLSKTWPIWLAVSFVVFKIREKYVRKP